MSILIDASKYLKHTVVLIAHQFLLKRLDFLHCSDFLLADTDDAKLHVAAKLYFTVVNRVDVVLLGAIEVFALAIAGWAEQLAQAKHKKVKDYKYDLLTQIQRGCRPNRNRRPPKPQNPIR